MSEQHKSRANQKITSIKGSRRGYHSKQKLLEVCPNCKCARYNPCTCQKKA